MTTPDMTHYRFYLMLRQATEYALICHLQPEPRDYHFERTIEELNNALSLFGRATAQKEPEYHPGEGCSEPRPPDYVEVETRAWHIYDGKYGETTDNCWGRWCDMTEEEKKPYRVLARSALDEKARQSA